MIFDGLGMWVWQEKYSPSTVKACIDAGVTHLIVRAWNGTGPVGSGFHQFDNYKAFVADGRIPIVPWTYVYGPGHGNAPRLEAHSFVEAVLPFKPRAVVVDIESEYSWQAAATDTLFSSLRSVLPDTLLAYSSFDLPGLHQEVAFKAIHKYIDVAIPQLYFAGRPVRDDSALERMYNSYKAAGLPISNIYPAIQGRGITQDEAIAVADSVRGLSIWRLGTLEYDIKSVAQAVRGGWRPEPQQSVRVNRDVEMGAKAVQALNRARSDLMAIRDTVTVPLAVRERAGSRILLDADVAGAVNQQFYGRG